MAYDDRYDEQNRSRPRGGATRQPSGSRPDRDRQSADDKSFMERAGEAVGSFFGGDDDRDRTRGDRNESRYGQERGDRSPGSHGDYYRGGDRGQRRTGPEGGFEFRDDYRHTDRYSEQGQAGYGGGGGGRDDGNYGSSSSGSGVGSGATGSVSGTGGPRFDRVSAGHVGTHAVHPISSPDGDAQRVGGMGGGGSSARSRAILDQAERNDGRGRIEPGQQAGSQQAQGAQNRGPAHDPHYSEWRRQQIEALDRDYDDYRTENASRFESEFTSFRQKRGQQRQSMGRATEHMEVVGSDGQHVGTVDKVAGERIILTKSDPNAGGHHHSIPCSWIETVDDKVTISKTAEQAMKAWRDEETSRALNEDPGSGSDGPHILDRSFSGTYGDKDR